MQAIIFPSENTPYDSGAFLFDIYCPPTYPQAAPMVRRHSYQSRMAAALAMMEMHPCPHHMRVQWLSVALLMIDVLIFVVHESYG